MHWRVSKHVMLLHFDFPLAVFPDSVSAPQLCDTVGKNNCQRAAVANDIIRWLQISCHKALHTAMQGIKTLAGRAGMGLRRAQLDLCLFVGPELLKGLPLCIILTFSHTIFTMRCGAF